VDQSIVTSPIVDVGMGERSVVEFAGLLAAAELNSHTLTLGWRPTAAAIASWIGNIPASTFRYVCRITKNKHAAEDCIQAGALAALDRLDQCQAKTEAEFRAWVRKIVINKAILFRRKCRRSRTTFIEEHAIDLAYDISGEVELCSAVEMADKVNLVVESFSPQLRHVFHLRFASGQTIQAISELLGRSPDTISNWLKKMLERIRKKLGNDWPA
jgi:RNA polymerase sigma factor (sigma-70 family)